VINESDYKIIQRYIDGTLTVEEMVELESLLKHSADARRELRAMANIESGIADFALEFIPSPSDVSSVRSEVQTGLQDETRSFNLKSWRWIASVAAILAVGFVTGMLAGTLNDGQKETSESVIAKIVGVSGGVVWTGDGGAVRNSVAVGQNLNGGTLEGKSPNSWVKFEFLDGSQVTVSGDSRLTFSDFGQKQLYLKRGNIFADVQPQPNGIPMLIHTNSATLEVVGTQFDVQSSLGSTALNVAEGMVRMKRRRDGETAEVTANHRLVANDQLDFNPEVIPNFTRSLDQDFSSGPDSVFGKWVAATDFSPAAIRPVSVFYQPPNGKPMHVYSAGFRVNQTNGAALKLEKGAMIRVTGRCIKRCGCSFGVKPRKPNGSTAFSFYKYVGEENFVEGQVFSLMLDPSKFKLEESASQSKENLDSSPFGAVDVFWAATLQGPKSFEVYRVEFLPAK
jgi:anti-sigma factor RsiW